MNPIDQKRKNNRSPIPFQKIFMFFLFVISHSAQLLAIAVFAHHS